MARAQTTRVRTGVAPADFASPPPAPTVAAVLPTTCPAARIGRELTRMIEASRRMEDAARKARKAAQHGDAIRNEKRLETIHARLFHLEEAITFERATSLEGALRQVFVASADAEQFRVSALTADQQEERGHRLTRLLYSIRAVLEEAGSFDGDPMGGDYYVRADFNPLLALDVSGEAA